MSGRGAFRILLGSFVGRCTLLAVTLLLVGCGDDPEERLLDRWQEVSWTYEKFDGSNHPGAATIDGIPFRPYADRRLVRHEAEYWAFEPDRTVQIALTDGRRIEGRWRLKGRGHVLTIRYADGALEVYDIKELGEDRLVLNSDLGMEVRGIARLEFRRVGASDPVGPGSNDEEGSATLARGTEDPVEAGGKPL